MTVRARLSRRRSRVIAGAVLAAGLAASAPLAGLAGGAPSDANAPDLVPLLAGYRAIWSPSGAADLHGTVVDAATAQHDDALAVWINAHATPGQRLRALQDAEYDTGDSYDQSITVSTALGSVLGPAYVHGRRSGALPLTSALVDSGHGTAGAYVDTAVAKAVYSHPRPFVRSDPLASAIDGDDGRCTPSLVNAAALRDLRVGKPYADVKGDLLIARVAPMIDTSLAFAPRDVPLDAGYGRAGICSGGSFPSGHTTTAYEAGITLATLLPELAPEILARASEAGNDRIVLGVHYPLDVMGGRIAGEAALAARWSDPVFRSSVLGPARAELVAYLETATGHPLAWTIRHQVPYRSNPYGGQRMPGGSAQIVLDRPTAVRAYTERLDYGFSATGPRGLSPSVPDGASNLLLTAFPTLTDAQRAGVLAQTQTASGAPLDGTGTSAGSWQRLDLAAATSATVVVHRDGSVRVTATGGSARVVRSR